MAAAKVYEKAFEPIVLKQLATECDIGQLALAEAVGAELGRTISRPTMNLVINRGHLPPTIAGFRKALEKALAENSRVQVWLSERGLGIADIWEPLGTDMRMAYPKGYAKRTWATRRKPVTVPGDPERFTIAWEVEMVSQEALKHFKVFRSPFVDDVENDKDIYMSEEHRYIEAAMLDAARHSGFLAVIGEVGSGKTVMRRKVIEQLKRDGDILVMFPQMIDKKRLTAASICDAIVQDISREPCKLRLEDKARQVRRLLLARLNEGFRGVLIIEEAHDLNVQTLKFLKRFHELEDGYRKLLSIILLGQTELRDYLDERQNVDMREVIRRIQVAEIKGLNGNLKAYLAVKFKRVGKTCEEIFAEDAYAALSQRLSGTDRGKTKVSHAYPLLVNNYVARAMNLACEMGEARISADVVMAL